VSEAIAKLEPHRTLSMRGFDRRGCAAAIHSASAGGFTVSGVFSDLADFVVLMLFDADDNYGHLFTTRYLPDFDLTNVVLEFDLAITGGMYPGSSKFPSVPWNAISYIESGGTRGSQALDITATTGMVAASCTFTVTGVPTNFDRLYIVYLGNVVFDTGTSITTGMTLAQVATLLVNEINAATSSTVPLTASSVGAVITVTCTEPGQDGNTIELVAMYKAAGNTQIAPATAKLTGGIDPTSFHVKIDFSALGIASLRQCWMTLAPSLPIDSGGVNPTLVPFAPREFSYVFSNWTVADPSAHTPLSVAAPGSVVVSSADSWVSYGGSGWSETSGFYYRGFARQSAHAGDTVTIRYSCQSSHDLYLGTLLAYGNGSFDVELDGVSQAGRATALEGALAGDSPIAGRRLLVAGVAAGTHTVLLTLAASASCTFDFLHAVIPGNVLDPPSLYPAVNAACDFDTNQTYQIPPARALWVLSKLGFTGDLDFYAGVFFALKRGRSGGNFHQATITITGYGGGAGIGSGFGDGDVIWITVGGIVPSGGTVISGATSTGGNPTGGTGIGGTVFGVAVFPADTLTTLVQRIVDGINALFVGMAAAPTATAGQLTVTVLSPINGFALDVSLSAGAAGGLTVTGDVGTTSYTGGQEGTWGVDATQASPINRAFSDYIADLAALIHTAGQTMTLAFSQELLAPPDANSSAGAWCQRFSDGTSVLTATAFGSWGAGYIESVASGVYQQTGHGYITGNSAHFASATQSGQWYLDVTDADHYTLGAQIANSGGYTPAAGDAVFIDLQTSQCNFNPATVTPYLQKCYVQAVNILAAAGLTPWVQFGEVGWWFFSRVHALPVGYASWTAPISIGTNAPHTLLTGQGAITCGIQGNTAANTEAHVTVVDSTHVTLDGSNGNGAYTGGGTISGGGMAYYDAYTAAAAVTALGRALATFDTQDDDPSVNAYADVDFLAGQIYTHISAIVAAVLAAQAASRFELLYPLDVNYPSVYFNDGAPYPQGGRLNAAVNLPAQFHAKSGSGLDRLKMEGLSWQSQYFHHDHFIATARFPYTALGWAKADMALLIAWDTGACPWTRAYLFFANEGIPALNLWAVDHLQLFSWPLPLPANQPEVLMS
jgi:hypothetical protein